ncbi:PIN domain-containing protein [candidate division WWE3 bacterium]|jgi:PIN domain nuclease of toxin-antitoxin system|uniref:PIN domain-containing protein n=1 Tax=candidate division WWE3 bacterium TaxID=2053526 RepID=A0A3A4ZEH4_UNCKA|nr:MAG: PIN domain-containing protein [candidate division WWE3 bacterium]
METYVADAHTLIWFLAEDERLSENAKRLLEQAEEARVQVLLPTVVLAEITYIAQKKKVEITIDEVLERIEQGDGFVVVPFDFAIFRTMLQLPDEWDIHDRIIGATSQYYNAILITKDKVLQDSERVETVW